MSRLILKKLTNNRNTILNLTGLNILRKDKNKTDNYLNYHSGFDITSASLLWASSSGGAIFTEWFSKAALTNPKNKG